MTRRFPGFADCHSHAFHRALRGREVGGGTFWDWRERMYAVAAVLDPELMHALALATYREMRLAGITAVGEFHYLHHGPRGDPYADRNEMGEALIAAAREAGLRICLLDACYLAAGFDRPVEGVQRRFADADVEAWAARVADLAARHAGTPDVVVGAAIHSVRAVPADALGVVARALPEAPLHVHVSEQPAENDECVAATGRTPVALLAEAGVWGPRTTAVHATHLTDADVAVLGESRTHVCFCPTTEAELADGIGPSVALRDAGARITLGSDSQTVIDPFAEARALAMHERLRSGVRGAWTAAQLWQAGTKDGHASLGFAADLMVALAPGSPRLAGVVEPIWAAAAGDVLLDGGPDPADVAAQLERAVAAVWRRVEGS